MREHLKQQYIYMCGINLVRRSKESACQIVSVTTKAGLVVREAESSGWSSNGMARHTTEICSAILRINVRDHSSRRYSLRRNAFGVMPNFLRKAKVR